MTISSLTSLPYSAPLSSQPSATGNGSTSATTPANIGNQLLAALEQSPTADSSSNSLLQELVSLSPAALGQTNTTPQNYNAQGLLQQVQSSMMLNDPLLQSDVTDPTNPFSNSLLGGLTSLPQMFTSPGGTSSTTLPTSVPTSGNGATSNTQALTSTGATAAADPSTTLEQLFKKDPALANVLVQTQLEQSVISLMA